MAARALKVQPTEDWKAKISASMLMNRLADHSSGKLKLGPTQVKSIEVILDRIAPKLSTIEQTVIDHRDRISEGEVLAELQGLFTAKPELLDRLIELRDAARLIQEGKEAVSVAQAPQAKVEST